MDEGKRKLLIVLVVVGFILIGVIQAQVDPIQEKLNKQAMSVSGGDSQELLVQLPGQFLLASVTGFKEVIAGALWVRADTFFHMGQYQAIIPIVRLVTWLDPHNIDVFTTGAWHLDYNFVDDNEMSDKRYIPASIALLKEGIANNPNMWDLYFELGWTHYNKKLNDYANALKYIALACEKDGFDANSGTMVPRPEFVDRMLAHQYEKMGRFEDCIKQWEFSKARLLRLEKEAKKAGRYTDSTAEDICNRNLSLLYLRLAWRYGNMDYYKKGVDMMRMLAASKNAPPDVKRAAKGVAEDYARRIAAGNPPGDALKPLDLGFQVEFKKLAPGVLNIRGKINLASASEYKGLASESATGWYAGNESLPAGRKALWRDGCRVNWMLADADYELEEMKTFNWKLDTSRTVVWDTIYVSGGSFDSGKIKLSDPAFYPFESDKYKLVVWITPVQPNCPDYVQDRVGWKGEAFYDKNYLDTELLPGFKCVKWEKMLTREDVI